MEAALKGTGRMRTLEESPHIQWFERHSRCRCGKKSDGILRGTRNESYGEHCQRCADRRLKASQRVRQLDKEEHSHE